MRKIKQANIVLKKFEKEINGLNIFHDMNPGVLWNGDKEVLIKLKRYPALRKETIRDYNEKNKKWSNEQ